MKIPTMLEDYLLETEQDSEAMSAAELFEEASWVMSQYKVGEIAKVDDFDDDRRNECAPGIHFFITRQEAVDW